MISTNTMGNFAQFHGVRTIQTPPALSSTSAVEGDFLNHPYPFFLGGGQLAGKREQGKGSQRRSRGDLVELLAQSCSALISANLGSLDHSLPEWMGQQKVSKLVAYHEAGLPEKVQKKSKHYWLGLMVRILDGEVQELD